MDPDEVPIKICLPVGSKRATVTADLRYPRRPSVELDGRYRIARPLPCSARLSLSLVVTLFLHFTKFHPTSILFPRIYQIGLTSPQQSQDYMTVYFSFIKAREGLGKGHAYLFRGWKDADTTGASKRIVQWRCIGSTPDNRSHKMIFQSFEDVNT